MVSPLAPRSLRALGLALLLIGVALPWAGTVSWLRRHRPPPVRSELRPELVELPPGTFLMGSPEDEPGRFADERQHEVRITRRFTIARTEVTQAQYREVTGKAPSRFKGDDRPVEQVSWDDAVAYCNALSRREGLTPCYEAGGGTRWQQGCDGYRLPTEAEWEYAARAGQRTRYAGGDDADQVAWYEGNAGNETHPVGKKAPNRWGLHDMSGNVWEWVWDFYAEDYGKETVDPIGPTTGPWRVIRGGSFGGTAQSVRVADRNGWHPANANDDLGFRVARSLP